MRTILLLFSILFIGSLAIGQSITNITPNTGDRGSYSLPVVISGSGTNFSNATSTVVKISQATSTMLEVLSVNNVTPNSVSVNIRIPNNAVLGNYSVSVYDQSLNGMITLPNGFTVTPNSNPAVLVKTTPNKVALNQTLPITITVNNANFSQATNNTMYLSHQGTSTIINPTSGSVMGLNNSHIRGTYTFSGSGLAVGSAINSHCGNSFDGTFSDFSAITITAPTTISGAINYVGNYTGVVELYQEVPNANPSAPPYYSLVASSNVVGNNYSFTNVAEADYYIRSVPVGMSDVVATYYAADISWQTATLVTTNPTVPSVCNITPITSLSLGSGAVNVNGTLGYGPNGYNKAQIVLAEGVEVFLKDVTGNTFAQTVTDQNGEYSFNGLLNGDYEIVIDIPGFDQISTYSFNVSNSTQNLNGLDFVIDDGEIFISNFLGFDALDLSELLIYPNPTIGELNIELPSNLTNVQVAIYNTMGQIVYQENQLNIGSKTLKTDLTALTEGVYILKVQSDQYTSETRLVKVK